MNDMVQFPYLTPRKGSNNLYYKRDVPLVLRAEGRQTQIWRSLKSPDEKVARRAYCKIHAEIEAQFDQWRFDDHQPIADKSALAPRPDEPKPPFTLLTPALLRRLVDTHYINVHDADFQWRGDLWKRAQADEEAFWRGDIIVHPHDDWHECGRQQHSYYAKLMEEPNLKQLFVYCISRARKAKLRQLKGLFNLADCQQLEPVADNVLTHEGIAFCDADRSTVLRKCMKTEIKALEDLIAGNDDSINLAVDQQAGTTAQPISPQPALPQVATMSTLAEKYLDDTAHERQWPIKTLNRKRSELGEFVEIVGAGKNA